MLTLLSPVSYEKTQIFTDHNLCKPKQGVPLTPDFFSAMPNDIDTTPCFFSIKRIALQSIACQGFSGK